MSIIQSHAHAVSYTHLDVYKRQDRGFPGEKQNMNTQGI